MASEIPRLREKTAYIFLLIMLSDGTQTYLTNLYDLKGKFYKHKCIQPPGWSEGALVTCKLGGTLSKGAADTQL